MPKVVHRIFYKSLFSLIGVIAFCVLLLQREGQSKASFSSVSGTITYFEKEYGSFPRSNDGKHRYLQLDSYPMVFELFIGKDPGDFSPKMEKVDVLATGDAVTVYFSEQANNGSNINRLAYFIDRGDEAIFIKGDGLKTIVYVIIGICLATIVLLWVLKRRRKIA